MTIKNLKGQTHYFNVQELMCKGDSDRQFRCGSLTEN